MLDGIAEWGVAAAYDKRPVVDSHTPVVVGAAATPATRPERQVWPGAGRPAAGPNPLAPPSRGAIT